MMHIVFCGLFSTHSLAPTEGEFRKIASYPLDARFSVVCSRFSFMSSARDLIPFSDS